MLHCLASSVDLAVTAQGLEAGGSDFFQSSGVTSDKSRSLSVFESSQL